MNDLRIISALEHEVISVLEDGYAQGEAHASNNIGTWLTESEAQELLRFNDQRPGFCQRVSGGVKLAQYCGIVRLKSCMLEILPKVGMTEARATGELERARGVLLKMLHGARITVSEIGIAPQHSVRAPLIDIYIETFLHCALEQARRGLLCAYVPHNDDLPVVKGRFNAHIHIRKNLGRPHLLNCVYDEFTPDNSYNQAIRATLDVCRTWTRRTSVQRLWFETHARYASVTPRRMSATDVVRLPRNRTTRRYAPVLTWCEWILSLSSPSMSAGNSQAPGLLFDMNKLFEAYVGNKMEAEVGESFHVHRQGPIEPLAAHGKNDAFMLKPDITIWHAAPDRASYGIVRILDAKWKRLDPCESNWGVAQADVYQLLAYAIRYRCTQLELVYPSPDFASSEDSLAPIFHIAVDGLEHSNIQIKVKTIPLWV